MSNDIITADRDERYRHRSQQETPEPHEANTSDATREAMATIRLNATRRPCQRTRQEPRERAVSITTKLILRRWLSSQGRQSPRRLYVETNRRTFLDRKPRADQTKSSPWSPMTRAPGSSKTINKNKQQKQAAAMARGTRVTRATLTVRTTQASWLAATGTPSPDNKTSTSSNNNNSKIPCYFGGFPKIRGYLLFVLWPWLKQEKLSLFFQMVFVITKMPIRWTASYSWS